MKIKALILHITFSVMSLCILSTGSFAQHKVIAITIDDLPFVGEYRNFHLNMMMTTLQEHHIPATGFIIASEVRGDNWEMLKKFRDAGFGLGNHTYSHISLGQVKTNEYIQDIREADRILTPVLTKPKYFRYPFLSMGNGAKREAVLCYLAEKNYQVAPITIDSKDFAFNQRLLSVPELNRRQYLTELKPFYLEFIWQQTLRAEEKNQYNHSDQAQILLIHANLLNAYVLQDIIDLYKQNGYRFISLKKALKTIKTQAHCSQSKFASATKHEQPKEDEHVIDGFIQY